MKYIRDYKNWNKLKEIIDHIDIKLPFKEGEIWWVVFGVNVGIEIDGKGDYFERPAIIIKKISKDHALVLPITTRDVLIPNIHIKLNHRFLNTNSVCVLSQFQPISNNRLMRYIGILPRDQFIFIHKSIKDFI